MLVDIGVNLWHRRFDSDRAAVISRAQDAGVAYQILTGTSVATSQKNLEFCQVWNGLFTTVGVHPHDASRVEADYLSQLRLLAEHPRVVAIGETGLDFNRRFTPHDVQKQVFTQQVQLACDLNKPLFVHERDAQHALLQVLDNVANPLPPVVIHCFTGDRHSLQNYLQRGFYIGITGWVCDERRGRELQSLLAMIPLEKLLIETDAPFLTPRNMPRSPAQGRNEPAFLIYVLQQIATSLDMSEDSLAQQLVKNSMHFFQIASIQ